MVIAPIRCKPGSGAGVATPSKRIATSAFQGAGAFRGLRPDPVKFQLPPPPRQGAVAVLRRCRSRWSGPTPMTAPRSDGICRSSGRTSERTSRAIVWSSASGRWISVRSRRAGGSVEAEQRLVAVRRRGNATASSSRKQWSSTPPKSTTRYKGRSPVEIPAQRRRSPARPPSDSRGRGAGTQPGSPSGGPAQPTILPLQAAGGRAEPGDEPIVRRALHGRVEDVIWFPSGSVRTKSERTTNVARRLAATRRGTRAAAVITTSRVGGVPITNAATISRRSGGTPRRRSPAPDHDRTPGK